MQALNFRKGANMTPMELIATIYAASAVAIAPTWAIFQMKKH